MNRTDLGDVTLAWREDGDPAGAPVVFAHALGLDLRMWDAVIPLLPHRLRLIRYDARGHGASDCPRGPYAMGALVRDGERLLDALAVKACVFVGLSMGGLVAQGLAVKRPDLIRAPVLSNTAAKIGTAQTWAERVEAVRRGGMEAIAGQVMDRWFGPRFRASDEAGLWRARLTATPVEGYVATCAALAGADFLTPTSGLRLPTLAIAGAEDGSTPPDLVRETADLIPGARFELIRGAGHLPPVDRPEAFAAVLNRFLIEIGHGRS